MTMSLMLLSGVFDKEPNKVPRCSNCEKVAADIYLAQCEKIFCREYSVSVVHKVKVFFIFSVF
jgi:hypothetical protein